MNLPLVRRRPPPPTISRGTAIGAGGGLLAAAVAGFLLFNLGPALLRYLRIRGM